MKYFILFLAIWFLSSEVQARPHCKGPDCKKPRIMKLAQQTGLHPRVIARIQKKFKGRVVGVRPHKTRGNPNCKQFSREINIGSRAEIGTGVACKKADGAWETGQFWDVQVLQHGGGKVVIVTVNGATGKVVKVQK